MARPTRSGAGVLVGGAALAAGAWAFGLRELAVLAVLAAVALAISAIILAGSERAVTLDRRVVPRRLHVGEQARVVTTRHNHGRRVAPAATATDHIDGAAARPSLLGAVRPSATRTTDRTVVAARRGVLRIGPVRVTTSDPLGLVTRADGEIGVIECIVLPRVVTLAAAPHGDGDNDDATRHEAHLLDTAHDEFGALREFSAGDDVRHVHWPATARVGSPIVRQFEQAWHPSTTVVLDERATRHTTETYERSLVAAASVSTHAIEYGDRVRVAGTSGFESGTITDRREHDRLMDTFALATTSSTGSLRDTIAAARQAGPSGRLIIVCGQTTEEDRDVILAEHSRWGEMVVVSCDAETPWNDQAVITFETDHGFVDQWRQHHGVSV